MARIGPGSTYAVDVLVPAIVFGLGLSLTVAPLTAAVLDAIERSHTGIGSGVNNAVARIAGLLAVATLPLVVGVSGDDVSAAAFSDGFQKSMLVCAGMCLVGAAVAWATIGRAHPLRSLQQTLHYRPRGIDHPPCADTDPASDPEPAVGRAG